MACFLVLLGSRATFFTLLSSVTWKVDNHKFYHTPQVALLTNNPNQGQTQGGRGTQLHSVIKAQTHSSVILNTEQGRLTHYLRFLNVLRYVTRLSFLKVES